LEALVAPQQQRLHGERLGCLDPAQDLDDEAVAPVVEFAAFLDGFL